MGDTGEGNAAQYEVSQAIEAKCEADGCDFVILLGDNFYDDGVTGVDDPQWQTKFEEPYANLDMPFYAVLGNHDYNGDGLSSNWEQGPVEVQYTSVSDKWVMPATFYTFTAGPAAFIMLDTNSIFWDNIENGDQGAWYASALEEMSDSKWIFGAGHHPYLSNGRHGNAGDYDSPDIGGFEIPNPISPANGEHVKEFFDDYVCGTLDMYFAGHDHNRQWIDEPGALCGTQMVVSGAGAKTTDLDYERNDVFFQEYETEGFFYVVATETTLTGQFYDRYGNFEYERTITK
jgi:hypothetical protein